ncbi:MAG: N-acetyltransferase [Pseudomonadota bacterium]
MVERPPFQLGTRTPSLHLRKAVAADYEDIRFVETAAFGRPDEAYLVEALRASGKVVLELIAEEGGELAGHILFSRAETSPETFSIVILAPVAVRPGLQRQGIGGHLVRRGLQLLRTAGEDLVVVLGPPDFYPQFGFDADIALRISGPWSRLGPTWMAAPLSKKGKTCGLIGITPPTAFADID